MSLIELDRVSYRYPSHDSLALDGVSLGIEPGEFVVIAGASGSGKSTLLNAVSGLVPHFHGGEIWGRVLVDGVDTHDAGVGSLAATVGTLFQDPETQIVMGTARGELAFPLENRGFAPSRIARAVEETALALGIEALLDSPTAELSGGESQRVALGATLVTAPTVVCLDEPTSQLDPVAGDELISLLRRLNDERELTVLLAEHRLERCLPFADRVIALEHGRVAYDGDPTEFLAWAVSSMEVLATPGARLLAGLGLAPQTSVKRARAVLRANRLDFDARLAEIAQRSAEAAQTTSATVAKRALSGRLRWRGASAEMDSGAGALAGAGVVEPALRLDHVWYEIPKGPAILRSVSLKVARGERVALMGRNGAGKSTLLAHAAGLLKPTRGSVRTGGRVALLMQNPGNYLVHETVVQEASAAALERFGLTGLKDRHPRELSGGERQRLALAVVLGGPEAEPAALVAMDEPTRGMDRGAKDELAQTVRGIDGAVVIATHDPEFVAAFADRVVLLGKGEVIADGPAAEVLCGGFYFTTEVARILGGVGHALTAEQAIALLDGARQPLAPESGTKPEPATTPNTLTGDLPQIAPEFTR